MKKEIDTEYIALQMKKYSLTKFSYWLGFYFFCENKDKILINQETIDYICNFTGENYASFWAQMKSFNKSYNGQACKEGDNWYFYLNENPSYKPFKTKFQLVEEILEKEKYFKNLASISGIYAILVNDKICYVGQSRCIGKRLAQHYIEINNIDKNSEKKYKLLNEIQKIYQIKFIILEKCDEDNLNSQEEFYILKYNPPLNTQIPTSDPNKKFKIRSISNLTVDDLLKEINGEK